MALNSMIMKHLDKNAIALEWYTSDIGLTRIQRRWSQYKRLRNKASFLIRDAKRKNFIVSVEKKKKIQSTIESFSR